MPILFAEVQWTSDVLTNGWDYDANFIDQWTYAFMSTAKSEGALGACFWVFLGYDNNLAIIRPPLQNYERKPQSYSIQSFINGTAGEAATPTFTPSGGKYCFNQTVTLSCNTSDSIIHYTLDGSDPKVTSTIYSSPISVSSNVTIKAKAFKNGLIDSNVTSATYLISPVNDGFESASFSKWTGTSYSVGETASVSTVRTHHGTYSGRFTTNGGGRTETAFVYQNIEGEPELYARGYFYVSQSGIADRNDRVFFFGLAAGNDNLVFAGEKRTSSGTRWCLTVRQGTGFVDAYSSSAPATGRWYCVELHWKKDSVNGLAEMWVDGTRVCATTARNTAAYGDATRLKAGIAETYGVSSATVYADCVKLSPFYIGPEPAPPRINSFTASPTRFSPNGDGAKDSSTLAVAFNVPVNWRLDIKSSAGATFRTWTGTGSSFSTIWDGKNNLGAVLSNGAYNAVLSGSDLSGNPFTQATIRVTIDNTRPTATSVSVYPTSFNPRQGQTTRLSYTLSENSYVTVLVYNSAGASVTTLTSNVLQSAGTRSATWDGETSGGATLPAGTYTFRLYVTDTAGNRATTYPIAQTVRIR